MLLPVNGQTLYLNKPITCWAPVHFTGAHTKFTTSYCWVKNTYYLPWDDRVPMSDTEKRQMVPYYQWIPFILLAQARALHRICVMLKTLCFRVSDIQLLIFLMYSVF